MLQWLLKHNCKKSLKKKLPGLRNAIDGYITPEQAGKLKVVKARYENLESRKAELVCRAIKGMDTLYFSFSIFALLIVKISSTIPTHKEYT